MISPTIELRDAVIPLVKADSGFQLIAADRIYDRVPSGTGSEKPTYPFAGFGPMRKDRAEVGHWAPGWQLKLRLYTASTAYERDQAWTLAETVAGILEGTRPVLAGPHALSDDLRIAMMGDAIETGHPRAVFLDLTCLAYAKP